MVASDQLTDVVVAPQDGGVIMIADKEVIGSSLTVEDAAVAVRACRCSSQLPGVVEGFAGQCLVLAGTAMRLSATRGTARARCRQGSPRRDSTCVRRHDPAGRRAARLFAPFRPDAPCMERGAYAVLEPYYRDSLHCRSRAGPDGRQARSEPVATTWRLARPDAAVAVR